MRPLLVLPALLLAAAPVQADEFVVRNKGDKPIYRLYAWPSDFMPRSQTLILAPIQPGQEVRVDVENNWGRCEITFQADRNERKPKALPARKRKIPFDVATLDWCKRKTRTVEVPSSVFSN